MTRAIWAEWTKLRTVSSTTWLLLGVVSFTIALGAATAASANTSHCPSPTECFEDITKLSLTGVWLGQGTVAVFAALAMTNEYGTRMIHATLAAIPRRETVLFTKAIVVTATVLAAGTIAVLGSLIIARVVLPGNGFAAANGYPPLSLADGATLRAAVGTVVYLMLVGLLSLGVGAIVRDTAGAVTTILALVFVVPVIAELVSDPRWHATLQRIGPTTAGLAIQRTTGLDQLPIGPWAGLGVLAAWAASAMVIGALLFRTRDA